MPLHLQAFLMILAQDITIGIGYKTIELFQTTIQ